MVPGREELNRAEVAATNYALRVGRLEAVLGEIDEYVSNYVDIDWEGRPNWAMDIKVMLGNAPKISLAEEQKRTAISLAKQLMAEMEDATRNSHLRFTGLDAYKKKLADIE